MREIVFKLEVEGEHRDTLAATLELIYAGTGPTAWIEDKGILYLFEWDAPKEAQKFPTKMPISSVFPMAQTWLDEHKPKENPYNSYDGFSERGFNIKAEHNTITITPVWVHYGK